MNELLQRLNAGGIRYLLIGGQAMRLTGMPRSTMDWDFFLPPHDEKNLARLNLLFENDLDSPVVLLGPRGENFVQTYQTQWGVLQFHLGVPGIPRFDEAEAASVTRKTEQGVPVKCLSTSYLLAAKKASNRPQDQMDIEFLQELQRVRKLK